MSVFSKAYTSKPKRNKFKLNHTHKFSAAGGYLIPSLVEEVMPGDTVKHRSIPTVRLQPLEKAMMHKVDVKQYNIFVPMRLLWENYEKFFANPVPTPDTPVFPYFADIEVLVGSLADYMGLPTKQVFDGLTYGVRNQYDKIDRVTALQFYAYQKLFFDWFISRNLVDENVQFTPAVDGLNPYTDTTAGLRWKSWAKDYFTAALPEPQAGEAVVLPIGDLAPVFFDNSAGTTGTLLRTNDGAPMIGDPTVKTGLGAPFSQIYQGNDNELSIDPNGTLFADLETATGVDIESLRWAVKLQEFLEKNARGGTRYIELMLSHFGVRSSDARLQRSELVSVNSTPIVISEVLQTAPSTGESSTPLGELGGHGLSVGNNYSKGYFCEEHGYYISLLAIVPQAGYLQGIPRQFSRFEPLDFPWPSFAHLGAQEILNREIYYGDDNLNDAVFGYTDRYNDKRVMQSRASGYFRTDMANWHMDRIFQNRPVLSEDFVRCNPTQRVFAITDNEFHNYLFNVSHKLTVIRCLPLNSIPSFG